MIKQPFPLVHKRILYHHRTQGKGVEGVHIRGMIRAFRDRGWQVDLLGPPGVTVDDVAAESKAHLPKKVGWQSRFLNRLSSALDKAVGLAAQKHNLRHGEKNTIFINWELIVFFSACRRLCKIRIM